MLNLFRSYRTILRARLTSRYVASVWCFNCDWQGRIMFARGVRVESAPCLVCDDPRGLRPLHYRGKFPRSTSSRSIEIGSVFG